MEVKGCSDKTPLQLAIEVDNLGAIAALLDNGANMETSGPGGTPLHWAVLGNRLGITAVLLQTGANPGGTDQFGRTALVERRCHHRRSR